jgi:predicted small metal-binding protein
MSSPASSVKGMISLGLKVEIRGRMIILEVEISGEKETKMEKKMEKKIDFRELGLECSHSICARTEDEVVQKAGEHIQTVHAMRGFSKDFYPKVRAAIHEGICEGESSNDEMLNESCYEMCSC